MVSSAPWTVISAGSAAGEAGLAAAFIRAAIERGRHVWSLAHGANYDEHLVKAGGQPVSADDLLDAVNRSELVVCSTSLTCRHLIRQLARTGVRLATLESSWFPWAAGAPERLASIRRSFVAMPGAVFRAGLGNNHGRFALAPDTLDRVVPVGWFAHPGPRLAGPPTVLVYFGRGYEPETFICRETLGAAIAQVALARPDVRWRYLGPAGLPLPGCVDIHTNWLDETEFERLHDEADLVICHHGQLTIGRAAAAGARVLTLTEGAIFRPRLGRTWADYEVSAFARAGRVEAVYGPAPVDALVRRIISLLEAGRAVPDGGGGAEAAVLAAEDMIGAM